MRGESLSCLAQQFSAHEQTVRRWIVKRGVAIRPKSAFTNTQELEVVRLYIGEQRTMAEIAPLFNVSAGAIRKVLVRQGVQRRSQRRR